MDTQPVGGLGLTVSQEVSRLELQNGRDTQRSKERPCASVAFPVRDSGLVAPGLLCELALCQPCLFTTLTQVLRE